MTNITRIQQQRAPGLRPKPADRKPSVTARIVFSRRCALIGAVGSTALTVVTEPSPRESNPDRARSMSLRLRGWSLQRDLTDTRATVRARAISRTCLE